MNKHNHKPNHKGNVLLITLVLISIAAGVTVTAMRGTVLQEKMVANQNNKSNSFKAAETGAASFMNWLKTSSSNWGTTTWQNTIPTTATGVPNVGTTAYYWINPNDVVWTASTVNLKVRGYAKSDNSATANAKTTLQITMTKPSSRGSVDSQYIGSGMIAGDDIENNDSMVLIGNLSANGNISLDDKTTFSGGKISAAGDIQAKRVSDNLVNPDVPTIDVPIITNDWLKKMESMAAAVKSCNINVSGDQKGKIYYCSGNATVEGSFSNATIVARGNVTKKESSNLGGSGKSATAVTVAIAAKGNITFTGTGTDYSVFWANGNYTVNSNVNLRGTIVVGGKITLNKALTYTEITEVQNDQITTSKVTTTASSITQWQEIFE